MEDQPSDFYSDCVSYEAVGTGAIAGAAAGMAVVVAAPTGPIGEAVAAGAAAAYFDDKFDNGGWAATCEAVDAGINAASDFGSSFSDGGGSSSD